jgi:hypothetical protein
MLESFRAVEYEDREDLSFSMLSTHARYTPMRKDFMSGRPRKRYGYAHVTAMVTHSGPRVEESVVPGCKRLG